MNPLEKVQVIIESFDKKTFNIYIGSILASVLLFATFLLYRYYHNVNILHKKITFINAKRVEVKEMLERYEVVKKQQSEVNAILEKDKDFVIGGYFNNVLQKLGLESNKTRDPETSSEDLENGYTERKLYASFSNLNMQKLVELLDMIEQSERIYTKEIEIYKQNNEKTINVNLLIATIEPKIETPALQE